MLPTPLITLKVSYSSLYLLLGPLKWAQFIYITFLLWELMIFWFIVSSSADAFSRFGGSPLCILRWLTFLWGVWCVLSHLLFALVCITSLSYHCLKACLSPYKTFISLYTWLGCFSQKDLYEFSILWADHPVAKFQQVVSHNQPVVFLDRIPTSGEWCSDHLLMYCQHLLLDNQQVFPYLYLTM